MMQCADGIVQFIVIKKSQFVVDLSLASVLGIVECSFVQVDRSFEIALRRFLLRVLHQLSVARTADPVAAG